MLTTIQNEKLSLTVDSLGAQMMALRSSGGVEYLWNGDKRYWGDRAPTLFPFVGRLTDGGYTLHGKRYPMGIHGFAAASEFAVAEQGESHVVYRLTDNEETRKQYPFAFTFSIRYALTGSTVEITYTVENRSPEVMPFGLGGHPGFRVPLAEGMEFDDYFLTFSERCRPDRVGHTPQVYLSGVDTAYPLEDGRVLRLKHDLFDDDAIVLKNMAKEVTLGSDKTGRKVTVSYPQMNYLGLWHWPKTDAPYLCIEPWTSLPSRQDIVEEFTCKSDLIHLLPGKTYRNTWTITIGEE